MPFSSTRPPGRRADRHRAQSRTRWIRRGELDRDLGTQVEYDVEARSGTVVSWPVGRRRGGDLGADATGGGQIEASVGGQGYENRLRFRPVSRHSRHRGDVPARQLLVSGGCRHAARVLRLDKQRGIRRKCADRLGGGGEEKRRRHPIRIETWEWSFIGSRAGLQMLRAVIQGQGLFPPS